MTLFAGKHKDSVGNEIYVGEFVAYNRSGDVHIGRVVSIDPVEQDNMWRHNGKQYRCKISVKNDRDGKISVVRNSNGLRVIGL